MHTGQFVIAFCESEGIHDLAIQSENMGRIAIDSDQHIYYAQEPLHQKCPAANTLAKYSLSHPALSRLVWTPTYGRVLLLEQTHGNLSQEGHIFRGMAGAYP